MSSLVQAIETERKDLTLQWDQGGMHFYTSAGAAFGVASILRVLPGYRDHPYWSGLVAAGGVQLHGVVEELLVDEKFGYNDIYMNALGSLIGALANVSIRFDYFSGPAREARAIARAHHAAESQPQVRPPTAEFPTSRLSPTECPTMLMAGEMQSSLID